MKSYTLPVQTSAHLKKFITQTHGHPFLVDSHTSLGVLIITLLQQKKSIHISPQKKYTRFINFNDVMYVQIMMDRVKDYGIHLSDDSIIHINRFLESLFDYHLYLFVQSHINPDIRKKGFDDAIRKFMDRYGIIEEVDISFHAMQKMEYRKRKAIEKKVQTLSAQNPPGFQATFF